MSITVQVVSPYGVAGGELTFAFRQTQPPEDLVIEYGYRLPSDPKTIRLVPVLAERPGHGGRPDYGYSGRPLAVFPEPRLADHTGMMCDASPIAAPSYTVLSRLAVTADGDQVAEGRPRPYRLSATELAEFAGRTLRIGLHDVDAQW